MSTLTGRHSWRYLALGLFAVQASQLVLYLPGTDVSGYAWAQGIIVEPLTIAGMSVQTWAIAALALIIGAGIIVALAAGRTPGSSSLTMVAVATIVLLVSTLALRLSSAAAFLEYLGKLLLPILLFLYILMHEDERTRATAQALVMASNIFAIGQVLVCLLATGSFSAHRYYLELPAEYFGFYHHPYAFCGVLMVCGLIALRDISAGTHSRLNIGLFVADLALVGLSGVRGYEAGLALGILVVICMSFRRVSPRTALSLLVLVAVGVVYASQNITSGGRVADDFSNGRVERWSADLQSFADSASIWDLLFGRGPTGIVDLNSEIFNLPINSLNLIVDSLVNIGILGLLLYLTTWIGFVALIARKSEVAYVMGISVCMLTTALIGNVVEYPVVTTLFVISLFSVSATPLHRRQHALSRSLSTSVS